MYSRHAAVWMVNPGGKGKPAFVISARPAPLPPSSSFILPLPSALPAPKKKTYFVSCLLCVCDAPGFETEVTLMDSFSVDWKVERLTSLKLLYYCWHAHSRRG